VPTLKNQQSQHSQADYKKRKSQLVQKCTSCGFVHYRKALKTICIKEKDVACISAINLVEMQAVTALDVME